MHIYERSISICMWFVRRWCVKLKFNIFYFMVEMVIQQVQFFDNEFIANEDTSVDEECANQGWFNATEEERQTIAVISRSCNRNGRPAWLSIHIGSPVPLVAWSWCLYYRLQAINW